MINSRTYLLRNQIHDLVKFFQANRGEFEITAVLGELRGTEDQKKLEIKIFKLLEKEINGGVEIELPEPTGNNFETLSQKIGRDSTEITSQQPQGNTPTEPEGNSNQVDEPPVVVKGKRSKAKGIPASDPQ